jgi:hypothetical protein
LFVRCQHIGASAQYLHKNPDIAAALPEKCTAMIPSFAPQIGRDHRMPLPVRPAGGLAMTVREMTGGKIAWPVETT